MAIMASGDTIIHIRLTGASGKGVLVDENNVEIPIEDPPAPSAGGTLPPVPPGRAWRLSREEYEQYITTTGSSSSEPYITGIQVQGAFTG